MKLIIQIPCLNEEKTLPLVMADIPKKIDGIDIIETMIIDDGSTDKTIEVAKELGVTHIVKHIGNKGLGVAFKSGQEKALELGADILVNTDGDNQYPGKYIPDLVKPIIEGKAQIVISDRQTKKIKHFSPIKKFFQWLGSSLVRFLSGTDVPDTVSGFRAYSKESLLQLNVSSRFSYVLDTIVQAGAKRLKIESIKITTNKPTRESRLFKSIWQHMRKSLINLFRVYAMYNPLKIFFLLSSPFFLVGIVGIIRFLYFFSQDPVNTGKIQSLILSGVCLTIAVQFIALGIIGDLIAKNRKLIEDNLYYTKKNYFEKKVK
ncbi:MAG: glycosyltransferase family 2 protein [Candidatus Gracilibacteria bacterium]|nr:glycosyltransferase family 2 protein [Candidatus Gracilibacteria bacterium]